MRLDRIVRQKTHSGIRLLRCVLQSAKDDGIRDAGHVLNNALRGFLPSSKKRTSRKNPFDLRYGTDTSGIVRIASMDVTSPNYVYARYYKASAIEDLQTALQNLPVDHERFTFVDFGSGKGLALMAAAFYPFRRIVGVEFAADLHRIAKSNLEKFKAPERKCNTVESVHAEATEWAIPLDPLVCYFYEPFEAPVLAQVVGNLERSYAEGARSILILYHQPPSTSVLYAESRVSEGVILQHGVFSRMDNWQHNPYVLYTAGLAAEATRS
jgi:hypothetical protein